MRKKGFWLFLSSIFVLLAPVVIKSKSNTGQILDPRIYQVKSNEPQFLYIDLDQTMSEADFAISAFFSFKSKAIPQIFVSLDEENRYPSSLQAVNYSSIDSFSESLILIPSEKLSGIKTIYIGLFCLQFYECEGELTFEYPRQFIIEANEKIEMELGAVNTNIVRFQTSFEEEVERIIIHTGTMQDEIYEAKIFINLGNEIPYTGHSAEFSLVSWSEGAMIIIAQDSPLFCRNCNYTMSLAYPSSSSQKSLVEVYGLTTEVYLEDGNMILDIVSRNKTNTYLYRTGSFDPPDDTSIDIELKTGKVKAAITCDQAFDFVNESIEYMVDKPHSIILLQEKGLRRCQSGVYYISIYGFEDSIYSAQITRTKNRNISVEVSIGSVIAPGGTMNRLLYVRQRLSKQLRVLLTSPSPLEIKISPCENVNNCKELFPDRFEPFHKEDYSQRSTDKFEFELEKQGENQIATIDLDDSDNCYPLFIRDPELVSICIYNVLLRSNGTELIDYWLEVELEEPQQLLAEIAKETTIGKDERLYFVFTTRDLDITEVTFQLMEFNGRVEGYLTREHKYPEERNSEKILSRDTNITFSVNSICNYFIAIKGLEKSSFSLKVSTPTKNQTQNFVEFLSSETPQTAILYRSSPRYYGFYLDLNDEWEGSLNIRINSSIDNIVFFGINNDGKIPQPSGSTWRSNNQTSVIISDDINFIRKGVYQIGVFVNNSKKEIEEEIEFSIEYFLQKFEDQDSTDLTDRYHWTLSPTSFFNQTLLYNQIDYYKTFILPDDHKVTVYKEGNVNLFVSFNPHNKFPSEKRYTYSIKSANENSITLNKSDLVKACRTQDPKLGFCTFYVAVISRELGSPSYQISMTRNLMRFRHQMNLLKNGNEVTLSIPRENIDILYFYMLPNEDYYIKFRSLILDNVYVKLLDKDTDTSSIENIELPSSSSYNHLAQTFTLISGCDDIATISNITTDTPMLALVAVYFVDSIQDKLVDYTVGLRSHVKHIFPGQKHYDVVQPEQYKYFTVDIVPHFGTLLISANPLENHTKELSVVVASPCDWELPTLTSSSSVYPMIELYGSKYIQISEVSSGTWVIGLYSQKSSEFSLLTLCIADNITELVGDEPVPFIPRMDLTRDYIYQYYIYSPQTSNPLHIHFSRSAPLFPYYIIAIQKDEDILSHLPDNIAHQWSQASDIDPKACNGCLYIIAVNKISLSAEHLPSITISEKNNQTIVMESGYPIDSRLSPGSSDLISIHHMVFEDIYIVLTSEAERLEISSPDISISTRRIEVSCSNQTRVLKIPRPDNVNFSAMSQDELYQNTNTYIQIENPSDVDVKYIAITVPIREYNMTNSIEFGIGPKASKGIILYSENSRNEGEMIELEFVSASSQRLYLENYVPTLNLEMQAYYWSDSSRLEASLPVYKTNAFTLHRKKVSKDRLRPASYQEFTKQKSLIFKTNSKTGKFLFLIANPADESLILEMSGSSKLYNLLSYEQNFNESFLLQPGQYYTYQIALPGPGAWYLMEYIDYRKGNLESIRLSIQDGADVVGKEVNMTEVKAWFPYKETIGEGEHTKLVTVSSAVETPIELNMSSVFLPGVKAYDYSLIRNPNQSWVELKENDTVIFVHFNPVLFEEYNFQDTLVYTVQACSIKDGKLIVSDGNCASLESEVFYIHMKNETQLEMRGLQPGRYLVMTWVSVISQEYEIKTYSIMSHYVNIRTQLNSVALPNTPTETTEEPVVKPGMDTSSQWSALSIGGILLITVIVTLVVVKVMLNKRNQKREREEREHQKENELTDMEDSGEFLSSIKKNNELSS